MSKNLLLVTCLCAGMTAQAQDSLKTTHLDELVFTGSRMDIPKEKSGKSIYKISGEELRTTGARSLADALNLVPGMQTDGNFGSPGTNIDYYVRGAASKRTLILIDGVPFNDPSGIDLNYDLRLVDVSNIESIEVLRGGLSSLYGSGAAAAVVLITTKKQSDSELDGELRLEVGSFNTIGMGVNAAGKISKFSYGFSAGHQQSEGFSAAKGEGFEKDGMISENASVRLGYHVTDRLFVEATGAIDQFENDFDFGPFLDDPVSGSEYLQSRVGVRSVFSADKLKFSVSTFRNQLERRFNYGGFADDYSAENRQTNFQLNQALGEGVTIIAGLDLQDLSYSQPYLQKIGFTTQAPYASVQMEQGSFSLQMGGRLNNHSDYGREFVYNLNPSYVLDAGPTTLKFLTNYSTSYITPSLYQLRGPYGNQALEPERSEGWDAGVSFYQDGLELNAVYFQRHDQNPIDFQSFFDEEFNFIGGEYFNATGIGRVEGIEIDGRKSMGPFDLSGSIAWLNNLQGSLRHRIPRIKYVITGRYKYDQKGVVSLNYQWTGHRKQFDSVTFGTIHTPSFGLVNLTTDRRLGRFSLIAAVNNLFDESYDAILGYTSVGRNYKLALALDLGK